MTDMGILEFLEARLAEEEALALALVCPCGGPVCNVEYGGIHYGEMLARFDDYPASGKYAAHYAQFTPKRVVAEVATRRALIAHITNLSVDPHYADAESYGDCALVRPYGNTGVCDCGRDERVTHRLRIMASVYADHPDHDPAWIMPQ